MRLIGCRNHFINVGYGAPVLSAHYLRKFVNKGIGRWMLSNLGNLRDIQQCSAVINIFKRCCGAKYRQGDAGISDVQGGIFSQSELPSITHHTIERRTCGNRLAGNGFLHIDASDPVPPCEFQARTMVFSVEFFLDTGLSCSCGTKIFLFAPCF